MAAAVSLSCVLSQELVLSAPCHTLEDKLLEALDTLIADDVLCSTQVITLHYPTLISVSRAVGQKNTIAPLLFFQATNKYGSVTALKQ
jgi:hypothetical protein